MSGASRTNSSATRRIARAEAASPYSSPSSRQRNQRWGWQDLLGYFNPLRIFSAPSQEADEPLIPDPARALARRGAQLQGAQNLNANLLPMNNPPPPPPLPPQQQPQPLPPAPAAPPAPAVAPAPATPPAPVAPPPNQTNPPQNQMSQNDNTPARVILDELISRGSNHHAVEDFLRQKGDQPLSVIEYAGVVTLLAERVQDNEHPRAEPFRFSTGSASPEPPSAPQINFMTPGTSSGTPAQSSRKMLRKNPNGTYVYRGGGSSRTPTNRYHSPGFGRPSPTPSGIKLTPEKPKADGKRRRIGREPATPSSPPTSSASTSSANVTTNGVSQPAAVPSTPVTNGTPLTNGINGTARSNGSPVPSRGRTSLPARATTPAVPSPLRQAWGQSDSSPPQASSSQSTRSPTTSKPTRAASFMTELLKEVTPPKKPDLVNPYQAASPLPPRPAAQKPSKKRTRSSAPKPAADAPKQTPMAEQKEKDMKLSPQKIIEATLPKGATRARPPPDLKSKANASTSPAFVPTAAPASAPVSSRRNTPPKPAESAATNATNGVNGTSRTNRSSRPAVIIEEVSDEEGGSPPKRQKTTSRPATNGRTRSSTKVTVEEVEDVEMPNAQPPSYTLPSEVVEPAEPPQSRRSTSPTTASPFGGALAAGGRKPPPFGGAKSSAPRAPSKLRYSFQAGKDDKEEESAAKPVPAKPAASAFPAFAPPPTLPAAPASTPASASALPPTPTTAPAFTAGSAFAFSSTPKPSQNQPVAPQDAKAIAMAKSVYELPNYSFAIPTSSPGAGPSSFKGLQEARAAPAATLPKFDLSVPVKPKTGFSTTSTSSGFNWAAAGMKPPAKPAEESWKCSVCMLDNPASALSKCTVCEAPRPDKTKNATSSAPGFNWAAAGAKPPSKPAGETWTCKTCMLQNPASATDKCTVCDSPR